VLLNCGRKTWVVGLRPLYVEGATRCAFALVSENSETGSVGVMVTAPNLLGSQKR
jgi:hypothetical protein